LSNTWGNQIFDKIKDKKDLSTFDKGTLEYV
jgi:hypothetical protein